MGRGVPGPWTEGGQRAWRGQGADECGGLLSLPLDLLGPRYEFEKSFGVDCRGDPRSPPGHLRGGTPARPRSRPARVPLGARPPPPGRARAARSRLHQPGPGRPRVPGASAAPSGEPRAVSGAPPPAGPPREGDLSRYP